VIDVDAVIREELDTLAPPTEVDRSDWALVLQRARPGTRRPSRRSALRLLVAIPLLLLVAAAPAFTFSAGVRSLLGFTPPEPLLSKSRLLVSGPIGNGYYAHVWAGPSTAGGQCKLIAVDRHLSTPQHLLTFNGGAGCTIPPKGGAVPVQTVSPWSATGGMPMRVGFSISRRGDPAKWVPPHVEGALSPKLHATRVEIEWNGGSRRLTLNGNNFVGGGAYLYEPSFANLPYYVVAYDAGGHEVARHKLENPSLYLVNGWKAFTPLYLAWKKGHHR
jgi:hypothetical protein